MRLEMPEKRLTHKGQSERIIVFGGEEVEPHGPFVAVAGQVTQHGLGLHAVRIRGRQPWGDRRMPTRLIGRHVARVGPVGIEIHLGDPHLRRGSRAAVGPQRMRRAAVFCAVQVRLDGRQVADQVFGLDGEEGIFGKMRDVRGDERILPLAGSDLDAVGPTQGIERSRPAGRPLVGREPPHARIRMLVEGRQPGRRGRTCAPGPLVVEPVAHADARQFGPMPTRRTRLSHAGSVRYGGRPGAIGFS